MTSFSFPRSTSGFSCLWCAQVDLFGRGWSARAAVRPCEWAVSYGRHLHSYLAVGESLTSVSITDGHFTHLLLFKDEPVSSFSGIRKVRLERDTLALGIVLNNVRFEIIVHRSQSKCRGINLLCLCVWRSLTGPLPPGSSSSLWFCPENRSR